MVNKVRWVRVCIQWWKLRIYIHLGTLSRQASTVGHINGDTIPSAGDRNTVYPKKYAHGFCFIVLCCGYTKQPWWIWINTTCEFIINDCIATTKQSTTKPCAYFLGYTVNDIYLCTSLAMPDGINKVKYSAYSSPDWLTTTSVCLNTSICWLSFNSQLDAWCKFRPCRVHYQSQKC